MLCLCCCHWSVSSTRTCCVALAVVCLVILAMFNVLCFTGSCLLDSRGSTSAILHKRIEKLVRAQRGFRGLCFLVACVRALCLIKIVQSLACIFRFRFIIVLWICNESFCGCYCELSSKGGLQRISAVPSVAQARLGSLLMSHAGFDLFAGIPCDMRARCCDRRERNHRLRRDLLLSMAVVSACPA